MAKITRYQGDLEAFGSNAVGQERVIFGDTNATQSDDLTDNITAALLRGWGALALGNKPPREWFNSVHWVSTQLSAYLHQMGVAEWHVDQEYYGGSVTSYNGELWQLPAPVGQTVGVTPEIGSVWQKVSGNYHFDSMKSLEFSPSIKSIIFIDHFYNDGSGKGGVFVYDPNEPKANHDGGTILDPAIVSSWDGTQADISSLFASGGAGNGCYKRINTSESGLTSAYWFGLSTSTASESINQAISSIASGNVFIGENGKTWNLNSTINGKSNVSLFGEATLDSSAITTAIDYSGSLGSSSAMTANSVEGDNTVTVADGSIFSEGEWVLVHTETSYIEYKTYNVARGIYAQIRSISGNQLTFTIPLIYDYDTADGAKVHKINFVENFTLSGLSIVGSDTPAAGQRGVNLLFCKNFSANIRDISGIDIYSFAIDSCVKFNVKVDSIRGVFYDGVTGTIFYGLVLLNSSQHGQVQVVNCSRQRHAIVTTAASAGQGRYGAPTYVDIIDSSTDDSMQGGAGASYGFEARTGRFQRWNGLRADGCYSLLRIEGVQDSSFEIEGSRYDFNALILSQSGPAQILRNITVDLKSSDYTGIGLVDNPAVKIFNTEVLENVTINAYCTRCAVLNSAPAVSVDDTITSSNVKINGTFEAGGVERTVYAVSHNANAPDIDYKLNLSGWRNGYSFPTGDNSNALGGKISNYSTAGSGFGFNTDGGGACVGVMFENIHTPVRFNTSSSNAAAVNNVLKGNVGTVSDGGTGNVAQNNVEI